MPRLFVVSLFILFKVASIYATDLTFGKIISPVAGQKLRADDTLAIAVEVKNINILPADTYSVQAKITPFSGGEAVYASSISASNLMPGSTQTLEMPAKWLMRSGKFILEIKILFAQDINTANNTTTIDLAVDPCCAGSDAWRAGAAPVIIHNLNVFPSDRYYLDQMRPGDVIAISTLVEDYDMLQQTCACIVNDDTLKTIRYSGPYRDRMIYEWTLNGPGRLIQPGGRENNAVLYEIPLCDTNFAMIKCVVRNDPDGGKAMDEILTGGIIIKFSTAPKLPPANTRDIGNARFLKVYPIIDTLKAPTDNETLSEVTQSACIPQPPEWLKSSSAQSNEIQIKSSDLTCPDYLILLSVDAADIDSMIWQCRPDLTDICSSSRLNKGRLQPDALSYKWRIIGGRGLFPLGAAGQTSVFWRSKNDTALVECEVTDETGRQFPDGKIILSKRIDKSRNPKAYVGIGGISYTKLGINFGDNAQLEEAALQAEKHYAAAGYDVDFDASAVLAAGTSIRRALRDPCAQAFWIVGHGTDEDSQYKGTIELSDERNFMPRDIISAARDAFHCERHPILRELVLMGCYSGRAKWSNTVFSSRIYGFPGALLNARWFMHEVLDWENDQHFPPYPHDLRMP